MLLTELEMRHISRERVVTQQWTRVRAGETLGHALHLPEISLTTCLCLPACGCVLARLSPQERSSIDCMRSSLELSLYRTGRDRWPHESLLLT